MASFNKVILMGNLTRDPESRTTPSGMAITKFSLAVNRRFNDRDGNQREEVSYIDCDSFGKQAEVIARYMSKGRPILVEGRLRQDSWETDGQKRTKLVVVVENFQFAGSRGDSEGGGDGGGGDRGYSNAPPRRSGGPRNQVRESESFEDDDVPF